MFIHNTSSSSFWSGIVLDKSFFSQIKNKFQHFDISLTNVAHVGKIGHGPLSPGAAIPTLFLPTVTLGFRAIRLGIA
jgi:hypothetical protein